MSRTLRFPILMGAVLMAAGNCLPQSHPKQVNLIHVVITGFHSDKGHALCALFSSALDFPKRPEKAIAQVQADILHESASCDFTGIAPGTYAVSVFHDENSNGKLDAGFLGIPREGVGASNNATGHFGPPKFEAAAFHFAGGQLELNITIHYL